MFTKTPASPRLILALIVTVFVFRAVLAISIVPPWQHPDEPQHFAWVYMMAWQQPGSAEYVDLDLEARILHSMSEHGWWHHYDEPEPSPFPKDFSQVPDDHVWRLGNPPRVYYALAGVVLAFTGPDDLMGQYYLLRWVALAFAVPTIMCIWAGSRRLFGVHVAAGSTLLTALHPQFVLMSTAVNPDVLVYLCGAVVWWQAARFVTGGSVAGSLSPMLCVAMVAFFIKRSATPLLLMSLTVPVLAGRVRFWGTVGARGYSVSVLVGVAGLAIFGVLSWAGNSMSWLADYRAYLLSFSRMGPYVDYGSSLTEWWTFFKQFSEGFINSFWLVAGWLRYPAPASWLLVVHLLTVAAFTGCARGVRRADQAQWRTGLTLAGVLVGIQLAGIYGGLFLKGFSGQGRFLFPVMGPFMVLVWIGIHSWWPQRAWPFVSTALLSIVFVLDIVSWLGVLVPAYVGLS